VAQESFVTAYRSLGGFRGDGPLRAWLVRIATRLAFRRLAQRRPGAAIDGISAERLGSHADDPARIAVVAERAADLRDAVAGLVEPYREVVALRFFGELSLAEIAETTGRPLNTVKTHLRRGLERLRPVIGQVDG
ncbi:MAG: RNA polymerase sigma factor, partial [Candidatus Limnocylindria bacterium]